MKRIIDFTCAFFGLLLLSPLLGTVMLLVWLQDFHSPFYIATRVRKKDRTFKMVKLRSMVVNADKIGGASTSDTDQRITTIGSFIRKYKLDEFMQLWNVLKGDMSLVGPRPQVVKDVSLYTEKEYELFKVKPGITDFSSIVFSDEGDILKDSENPDLKYNQVIRPWKSRYGLFYIEHQNVLLDIKLILMTLLTIVSRKSALKNIQKILKELNADAKLIEIAGRNGELVATPPPGSAHIETRF